VYDLNDSHVTQENKVLVKFSVLNDNDNECHRLLGCAVTPRRRHSLDSSP